MYRTASPKTELRIRENVVLVHKFHHFFFAMTFSNIFESIGSREMCRKSFIEFGEEILGIGMIAAVLKLSENDF